MRTSAGIASIVFATLVAVACDVAPEPTRRPAVAVSVEPHAWIVHRLAGDAVDVQVMVPPGASPATFEPTVRQMKHVSAATLYVKVGHPAFPFERAWLDRLLEENERLRVIDTWDGRTTIGDDPHTWVSPAGVRLAAERVAGGLTELLPEHKDSIEEALTDLVVEIEALDVRLRARFEDLAGRSFFVFHAAWGRFAAEYGLRQIAIEHGSIEPSPHELARLVDLARRERASVVFVQPQFSQAHAAQLAQQIGAEIEIADPLSGDWPENLERFAEKLRAALVQPGSQEGPGALREP